MPPAYHSTWYNIQMLRAVAVLMVAALHLEPYLVRLAGGGERYLLPFGYSGVDLFFIISGFINYTVSASHLGDPRYSIRFLIKRAIRILPNYWLIVSATFYLVTFHGMPVAEGYTRPLESFLLLYPLRVPEHVMITAWTLNYELLFYAGLALLIMLPPRLLWPCTLLFAFIVAISQNWMEHWNVTRLYEFGLAPYYLQFIAGMGIAHLARRGDMPGARIAILFGLVMAGITIWIQKTVYTDGFANPFHRDLRVWMWLCVYGPIVYGFVALEKQGNFTCRWRVPLLLGDASYSLYLWFMPFFYAAYRLTQWLVDSPVVTSAQAYWIVAPVIFLAYLIWSCLWYYFLERRMLRGLNRLILGRKARD